MSEQVPAVSVVIAARNAATTLSSTLAALAGQDLERPIEVIVVDNGSIDETAEIARSAAPAVRVLERRGGRPGGARNLGVAAARAAAIAFTDADCEPEPGWLRAGLAAIDDGFELVQGAVEPDPARSPGPFDRTLSVGRGIGLHETANLFITRAAFERVGGFEDVVEAELEAPFGEDVLLGWRARRAGARFGFCEAARVRHAVFARGPAGYVAERRRCEHFPALARLAPELRETMFVGRVFLSRRSAAFDLALAGLLAAGLTRRRGALLAVLPYAATVAAGAARWRRRAPLVAAVDVCADAVALASLVRGSLRDRSLVI